MEVGQVAPALVEVEAVADEELVGDGEADVVDREVFDQAAIGPVEQRDDAQARRLAQAEQLAEVVQRQAGVDDVLDEQHVEPGDGDGGVLQQPDARVPAGLVASVAGELDEVDLVRDRDRPAEVREEDEARLQQPDQQQVAVGVVGGDLRAQLLDARANLVCAEEDLSDARVRFYQASSSRYRWASRSMSRL